MPEPRPARKLSAKAFRINASGGVEIVLVANAKRVGIWFCPPSNNNYSVMFGESAVSYSGLAFLPTGMPVYVSRENFGEMITRQVSGIASVANTVFTGYEVLED